MSGWKTLPRTSNYRSNDMNNEDALNQVAQRYRNEGYDVVLHPNGDAVPGFAGNYRLDLIATRPGEKVVVQVKKNRAELEHDSNASKLAELVNAQPGWRFDLVLVEPESTTEKALEKGVEPTEDEILEMISDAERLAQGGSLAPAYVFVWGALEAAMRNAHDSFEPHGRTAPSELIRMLYSNGLLSEEEFVTLRDSFDLRSQIVHGMKVSPQRFSAVSVEKIAGIARRILSGNEKTAA
jgi:hypothetical protein